MADLDYQMVVTPVPEEDGSGYLAFVPDLTGCMGVGDTPEEAVSEVHAVIQEWIDEAKRLGRDVPAPGAMGDHAQREHQKLHNLIAAQEDMTKEQDRLLKAAREEISEIRDSVVALLGPGHNRESRTYQTWLGAVIPVHAIPTANRRLIKVAN